MTMSEDVDDLKAKRICLGCVGETFLRTMVMKEEVEDDCDYCDGHDLTMAIGTLADVVDDAFKEHYFRTSPDPSGLDYTMMSDRESNYVWSRDGEPVVYAIAEAAEIPETAAKDTQEILNDRHWDIDSAKAGEETEYHRDSHYERRALGSGDWMAAWRAFEKSVRTENRFFSPEASDYLAAVFEDVHEFFTPDGTSVVVGAGPDRALTVLYRARVFQTEGKLVEALKNLDRELGPPPATAALAGRMNARGIAVFYGATDPSVALAEIRPPVGSRVVVGRFDIIRQLRFLDVMALRDIAVEGSIFDPAYGSALQKAAFLDKLSEKFTRPVMPDDEALDYVITQAVADYLSAHGSRPLDGLIYRSAQASGEGANVVLFHKASRVQPVERPKGTEVDSSGGMFDEDGWHVEYKVVEWVPRPVPKKSTTPLESKGYFGSLFDDDIRESDPRVITLRLDLKSVKVHEVKAVQFTTETHAVDFHRWERNPFSEPM